MGFPQYRYTGGKYADFEDREKHEEWAAAWTKVVADAVGGLDFHDRHDVYSIIREIRRRVEAGDYGPPIAYPQPGTKAQGDLKLEQREVEGAP